MNRQASEPLRAHDRGGHEKDAPYSHASRVEGDKGQQVSIKITVCTRMCRKRENAPQPCNESGRGQG